MQASEANGALRVHAMVVQRAPNMDGSPYDGMLLKRSLSGDLHASMRAATVEWLAAPLGGDTLAAELLLLQLITRRALLLNEAVSLYIACDRALTEPTSWCAPFASLQSRQHCELVVRCAGVRAYQTAPSWVE